PGRRSFRFVRVSPRAGPRPWVGLPITVATPPRSFFRRDAPQRGIHAGERKLHDDETTNIEAGGGFRRHSIDGDRDDGRLRGGAVGSHLRGAVPADLRVR